MIHNAAFFPTTADTLPIALHINKHSLKYKINTFLSFPGSGICEKDIGVIDNRGNLGIVAHNCFSKTVDNWDILIISSTPEFYHDSSQTLYHTLKLIEIALSSEKNVICAAKLPPQELQLILQHPQASKFKYLYKNTDKFNPHKVSKLYTPSSYVVFCGGLLHETNSFEPFLSLFAELSNKYNVLALSTDMNSELCGVSSIYSLLNERQYSESEKIYAINTFVRNHSESVFPDLIMVHLAEPLMAYNDNISNGFGMFPYLVSKALLPDFFVCGLPVSYGYTNFINSLNNGVSNRLGFEINYIHLSNVDIDSTISFEEEKNTFYTKFDAVDRQLELYCADSVIPVSNLLEPENINTLSLYICDEVNAHHTYKSLI